MGQSDRLGSGFSGDGRFHAASAPVVGLCPRCGETAPSNSLICCACGRLLPTLETRAGDEIPPSQPHCRKALASLILGCFSFLLLPGLAAVILGHLAKSEIKRSGRALKGEGFATAGLILGYLSLLSAPVLLALFGFPGRLRTTLAPRKESTINSLRVLNIALEAYAASYGRGFPERLSQLAPPRWDEALNANASGFVAYPLASGNVDGYRINYTITARDSNGFPSAYALTADPVGSAAAGSGFHFYTDQTQVIRSEQSHPATNLSPPAIEDSLR